MGVARQGGVIVIGDTSKPDAPVSHFTPQGWSAFVVGIKSGDFDDLA